MKKHDFALEQVAQAAADAAAPTGGGGGLDLGGDLTLAPPARRCASRPAGATPEAQQTQGL